MALLELAENNLKSVDEKELAVGILYKVRYTLNDLSCLQLY